MSEPRRPTDDEAMPQGRRARTGDSDGFSVEPTDAKTSEVPTIVRRRGSGAVGSGVSRASSDGFAPVRPASPSGGFVADAGDGPSYTFDARTGPGFTGAGRAGGVQVSPEIQAAEQDLLRNLGHRFVTSEPIAAALTHPSWRNERPQVTADNQRLEFLGDLVVGLAVGDILLQRLPEAAEGELSVLKSQLVRESALATLAERLGVGPALRLGRGEEQGGGRQRPAVLADAMEAILGAVFLDAGYDQVRALVERLVEEPLEALLASTRQAGGAPTALHARTHNYKTALQEWLASAKADAPVYTLLCELGSPESRRFRVQVETCMAGLVHRARGEATTIKGAENAAAERLDRALTTGT